jgi:hypothetical protein
MRVADCRCHSAAFSSELAERVGFEPTVRLPLQRLSSPFSRGSEIGSLCARLPPPVPNRAAGGIGAAPHPFEILSFSSVR